jgi:hypothetical protein
MPREEFSKGEAAFLATPIRDLGLQIAGSPLEPILADFRAELECVGIRRLRPHFYLSDEWGVPFGTTSIAIPFYLARPELTALHAEQTGLVEGTSRADILRYLRHEMGHVVNYGYRLYEQEEWVKLFGAMTQPYEEEFRPEPWSRRFVIHLPGWYAQKHPDEDWSETFAVWMTPGLDWGAEYAGWPEALAKLEYCDRTLAALRDRDPVATEVDLDAAAEELPYSLQEYYRRQALAEAALPPGLDGSLRSIFEELGVPEDATTTAPRRPASALVRRLAPELTANVYRWTGLFPERTRALLQQLAERCDQLRQVYPADREVPAAVALTTLVTALAMNRVHRGSYAPQ